MLASSDVFSTLDLKNFTWLLLWKRDQELRVEIEKCQKAIDKIKKSPFSREEVREQFERVRQIFRERRLELINLEAENVQSPHVANEWTNAVTPFYKSSALRTQDSAPLTNLMSCFCIFEIPGVWEEIEGVISRLPKGVSKKDKRKLIEKEEANIDSCYKEIKKQLSPKERWVYDKRGNPKTYPRGCRWTRYVEVLKQILPYLEQLADIDNKPLSSEAIKRFKACGFHKLVGTAKIKRLFRLGEQVGINFTGDLFD